MRDDKRLGAVGIWIGALGRADAEMGAEILPTVADLMHQQALGRHGFAHPAHIRFIGGDGVSAVLRPAAEDLIADQRQAERLRSLAPKVGLLSQTRLAPASERFKLAFTSSSIWF